MAMTAWRRYRDRMPLGLILLIPAYFVFMFWAMGRIVSGT